MTQARCGSWPSPITSGRIASGALRLSQPRLDAGWMYWLEGRPEEGGRQVVVRRELASGASGAAVDVTPAGVNVRTRVHEYGGGDYCVARGLVYFVDFEDQRIWEQPVDSTRPPRPISAPGPRYADLQISPDGAWLVAVEEQDREGEEAQNRLAAFSTAAGASQRPMRFADRWDFVSFPAFSPDGKRLAFTAWDHPRMPWDETHLLEVEWRGAESGTLAAPVLRAGRAAASIFQPTFSPDGRLTYASDHTGWWNLYQQRSGGEVALCAREADFGRAQWIFGMSTYAFMSPNLILCLYGEGGCDRLARLDLESGELDDLLLPFTVIAGLRVGGADACFVGAGPDRAPGIQHLDLETNRVRELRSGAQLDFDVAELSRPQAIEFGSTHGRVTYAFYYPPAHTTCEPTSGERPPLLVKSHGGPTAATTSGLDLRIQYWTNRGFAVVDVNYGGSSGYGRAYRDRLLGQWGIVDVEDCVNAARWLMDDGAVDGGRLAISGGSAGGFTTLCALTFHDVFHAGASHYGIGDLEILARDTHKFESRYLDSLIGPYPEERELYRDRSPIHATERLSCPVIFFQGLEDRVVPPNQAEKMVEALASRGIRHAYVAFPGEQHGFRRAENICTALDGELFFYSGVFEFEAEVRPEAVRIVAGAG